MGAANSLGCLTRPRQRRKLPSRPGCPNLRERLNRPSPRPPLPPRKAGSLRGCSTRPRQGRPRHLNLQKLPNPRSPHPRLHRPPEPASLRACSHRRPPVHPTLHLCRLPVRQPPLQPAAISAMLSRHRLRAHGPREHRANSRECLVRLDRRAPRLPNPASRLRLRLLALPPSAAVSPANSPACLIPREAAEAYRRRRRPVRAPLHFPSRRVALRRPSRWERRENSRRSLAVRPPGQAVCLP